MTTLRTILKFFANRVGTKYLKGNKLMKTCDLNVEGREHYDGQSQMRVTELPLTMMQYAVPRISDKLKCCAWNCAKPIG